MYYTDKVKELLKRKNPNLKFTEEEVQKVNNGVIIRIIENSVDSQSNTLVQGRKNNSSDKNSFNGVSNKFLYEFIKQTSDGLVYLHKNNIIHSKTIYWCQIDLPLNYIDKCEREIVDSYPKYRLGINDCRHYARRLTRRTTRKPTPVWKLYKIWNSI